MIEQESGPGSTSLRYCFEGDFSTPLASGRYIRELVLAARGIEMPLAVKFYPTIPHCEKVAVPPIIETISRRPPTGRVRVVCQPAFLLPEKIERGLYWAMTAFDPLHPNRQELERLKHADLLWLPSEAHATAAQAAGIGKERIKILPGPVNQKVFHPRAKAPEVLKKGKDFTFLFVGNPLRRKGLDLALWAYLAEFKAKEPVRLVIKLTHMPKVKKNFSFEISDLEKRLGALNKMFPKVQIIAEPMEDPDFAGLLAGCHVLVSTNRSYHSAIVLQEARAVGLPIIGPAVLKQFFLFDEKTGFPVKTGVVTCKEGELFKDSEASKVEEVDIPDLRRRMREAFTHADEASGRGKAALRDMKNHPTWRVLAQQLLNIGDEMFAAQAPGKPKVAKKPARSSSREHPSKTQHRRNSPQRHTR